MADNEANVNKAEVRAWLFHLLADLETYDDVEATKTETAGNQVIIEIQFKT